MMATVVIPPSNCSNMKVIVELHMWAVDKLHKIKLLSKLKGSSVLFFVLQGETVKMKLDCTI